MLFKLSGILRTSLFIQGNMNTNIWRGIFKICSSFRVRHRCLLTLILFSYAIECTMNNAVSGYPGVQVRSSVFMSDLKFTRYLIVLTDSPAIIEPIFDRITLYAMKVRLKFNTRKTQAFSIFRIPGCSATFRWRRGSWKTPSFKQRRTFWLANGNSKNEVITRIDSTHRTLFRSSHEFRSQARELDVKQRFASFSLQSALGSFLWVQNLAITPTGYQKVRFIRLLVLRMDSSPNWEEPISSVENGSRCSGSRQLSTLLQNRRRCSLGHVLWCSGIKPSRQTL